MRFPSALAPRKLRALSQPVVSSTAPTCSPEGRPHFPLASLRGRPVERRAFSFRRVSSPLGNAGVSEGQGITAGLELGLCEGVSPSPPFSLHLPDAHPTGSLRGQRELARVGALTGGTLGIAGDREGREERGAPQKG